MMQIPCHKLKTNQLSNLEAVYEIVKDFSNEAGIDCPTPSLNKDITVLESGHQPNFLPHAGIWKKLFLLEFLTRHSTGKAIALFGFADYNLCTSRLLAQNKLPAFNKLGYEKIGFRISGKDVWKRFDHLEKPKKEEWENEMKKIQSHYTKYPVSSDMELNLAELMEILEECYGLAKNFPDMNAFFIARVSELLNLNIGFFRYSDLQRKRIFLEEWEYIIFRLEEYNTQYNNAIQQHGLDIRLCSSNALPFWYHCPCGAKVHLWLEEKYGKGECRLCFRKHEIDLDRLKERFGDMSPNAVARNVIFSEGMGTHVFISGTGGGVKYGKISDAISKAIGFSQPVTISWQSRDYYLGPAHVMALRELRKICGMSVKDMMKEDINTLILNKKLQLKEMTAKAKEKEEIKKYKGQYRNLDTLAAIVRAVYSTIPSFMDIFVSQGARQIIDCWEYAVKNIGDDQQIVKDVVYGNQNNGNWDIVEIYKNLEGIRV